VPGVTGGKGRKEGRKERKELSSARCFVSLALLWPPKQRTQCVRLVVDTFELACHLSVVVYDNPCRVCLKLAAVNQFLVIAVHGPTDLVPIVKTRVGKLSAPCPFLFTVSKHDLVDKIQPGGCIKQAPTVGTHPPTALGGKRLPGVAERVQHLLPERVIEGLVFFVPGDYESVLVFVVHLQTNPPTQEAPDD